MVRHAALKNLYELEKTLGTGGFAKVKLARHLLTGEKVAIKIMNKELLGEDLPRVKMELEALKNLNHHHICRLYQVIETETHFFLVMEYCAGGELFDHIVQCNRLSEMESRSFFRQILSAVAYLHSKGYVHRDIKPENVLLDKDQGVKLIDFGLCAKPSPGPSSYLQTACGSPTYAAPELIRGDEYLGSAVDVWSMGVMLYALLCGCLPFESDKIDVLYKQILSGSYSTPDYLSAGSRRVLKDMLQTEPVQRVTVEQLLSHPWVQLGYNEPVVYNSIYKDMELDTYCLNTMALHFRLNGEVLWRQLQEKRFDDNAATYQLLLARKKQGLSVALGEYVNRTAIGRLQSFRRTVRNGHINSENTYVVLPKKKVPNKQAAVIENNQENKMQPPENTPVRVLRKRPHSQNRDISASPAAKKVATDTNNKSINQSTDQTSQPSTPVELVKKTNISSLRSGSGSCPNTPNTKSASSPSARLLNSIERKYRSVRKVLTPKRRTSVEKVLPNLLTAKNMCNISTTSSSSPDHVKEVLVRALNNRGIECNCKGYSVRGKQNVASGCKLSFELEIVLIPTATNPNGSVVGIRRKRLKGDSWQYKKVCEEVLNMANLK